jgi:hypothetical protein
LDTTKPLEFNLSKSKLIEVPRDHQEAVPFKALPLNRNILTSKQVGRLSVPPPKLTEAIGFNLSY